MIDISNYSFKSESVFDSLKQSDLAMFKKSLKLKKIKKGTILFHEGAYPKGVFILKRGKVKIFQRSRNGSEQIVYIYVPGDMFGYRPILSNDRHPASAMAIEDSGVYFLSPENFNKILTRSASFSNFLLRNLSNEFSVLVNRIAAFGQRSVKERLALSLLMLNEKYRQSPQESAEIVLSRTDLAALVGTTIETVARMVGQLKQDRIIKTLGRRIVIMDSKSLHKLAG
ncbi:MAG: Crp/Fnr family transcriptional regulator [Cyclobacteriaceae bacterium]